MPAHGHPQRAADRELCGYLTVLEPQPADRAHDPAVRHPGAPERRAQAGSGARPPRARLDEGLDGARLPARPPRGDHRRPPWPRPLDAEPRLPGGRAAAGSSLAAPINDRRTRRRCSQRCSSAAIGSRGGRRPRVYNLQEIAADAEDLRAALEIERWNLRGLGSGARIAFEILRRHGEHVRAVWLDSPEIPQVDLLTTGVARTRNATKELTAACASDRAYNRRFPSLERVIARNLKTAESRRRRSGASTTGPRSRSPSTAARFCARTARASPRRRRPGRPPSRRTASRTPAWATTGSRTGRSSPSATASIQAARIPSRTAPTSPPSATTSSRSSRSRRWPRSRAMHPPIGRRSPRARFRRSAVAGALAVPARPSRAPVTTNVPC